ncbi:hypothetical protein BDR06DRAFT_18753 [Suillus hirtellus]|nr:hypothetical protein BDR06DRAFT_18753 [Suillus hirtellus]
MIVSNDLQFLTGHSYLHFHATLQSKKDFTSRNPALCRFSTHGTPLQGACDIDVPSNYRAARDEANSHGPRFLDPVITGDNWPAGLWVCASVNATSCDRVRMLP